MKRGYRNFVAIEEHAGGILLVKRVPSEPYRNVVVALDLGPGAEALLEAARKIAPLARITAVHAYEVPYEGALFHAGVPMDEIRRHRDEALAGAVERIEALARRVAGDNHGIVSMVERGPPLRLVLEALRSLRADLVVIAQRRRPTLERLLLGSVTRDVIARAPCDVLVPVDLPEGLPVTPRAGPTRGPARRARATCR